MLLNSLILLLLSNSSTSRRDKSILYSTATITILEISAFIAYDNLSLLFLAKGVLIPLNLHFWFIPFHFWFIPFHFWFIPFHFWFILLFLYSQKHRITIKN